ncbi:MAG: hypothetical protein ACLQA5_15130 [Solirubrobacteraceae bacterium]
MGVGGVTLHTANTVSLRADRVVCWLAITGQPFAPLGSLATTKMNGAALRAGT